MIEMRGVAGSVSISGRGALGKGLVRVLRILRRKWFSLFLRLDGNGVEIEDARSGFSRSLLVAEYVNVGSRTNEMVAKPRRATAMGIGGRGRLGFLSFKLILVSGQICWGKAQTSFWLSCLCPVRQIILIEYLGSTQVRFFFPAFFYYFLFEHVMLIIDVHNNSNPTCFKAQWCKSHV